MKKLQKINADLFKTLEVEEAKKLVGGLSQQTLGETNPTVTWHKSTGTQVYDGMDATTPY